MRLHNGHVLGAAGFLAPVIGVVAPLGLPLLLVAAALGAIVVRRTRNHAWPTPPPGLLLVVGSVVTWSVLSLAWTIDPGATLGKLPGFVLLLAAGLILVDSATRLSGAERMVFARLSVAGFCIGFAVLLFERFADAPIRRSTSTDSESWAVMLDTYNRSVTVLALLIWPVVLVVRRRGSWWGVAGWILVLATIWFYSSNAAITGLVVGGFTFVLGRIFPRWAVRGLGAALALAVFASPLLPSVLPPPAEVNERVPGLPYSGYHRLVIWEFTAKRISERPVLGWGFNTSRSIPGRDIRPDNINVALPLHPHNAALQWWLELGVMGAMLGAGLIGWLFVAIGRVHADTVEKAMYLGLVLTAITICSLGFGIWQSWWLAVLWLSGGFMAAARQPPEPPPSPRST